MAGGLGAAGFGAGFGRGLTSVLLQNRQDKAAKQEREFQALLPIHLQLAQETGDYSGLENLIGTFDPELAQTLKKNSPFQQLHQFMGPQLQMASQQPEFAGPTGPREEVASVEAQALGEPAPLPSRNLETRPVPGTIQPPLGEAGATFFGTPVLTPTQKAEREREFGLKTRELDIAARRTIGEGMNLPPDKLIEYALTGQLSPSAASRATEPYQSVPGETADGKASFGVFDQTRGVYLDPITKEPIPGFRPKTTPTSAASQSEFESFLVAYAKDHNKTVDQLSAKERLDARSEYAKAGSTAQQKSEDKDPMALARLAVRQPTVLQGLTPTVTGSVMAAIASDPQLSAQYEYARMEPLRSQAQTAVDAMKDLIVVDANGQVTGLTPGAAGLYGVGTGRLARFYPGSQSATAKAALDQVTGALTLDLLKEMKAQSRTGATGFGQLSGRELDVLQSAATVLKGEISGERALQELKKLYERFGKILLPGSNEILASAGQPQVGPINLDTPVYIDPVTKKPTLTPPGR